MMTAAPARGRAEHEATILGILFSLGAAYKTPSGLKLSSESKSAVEIDPRPKTHAVQRRWLRRSNPARVAADEPVEPRLAAINLSRSEVARQFVPVCWRA